jgi:hypothetical protein
VTGDCDEARLALGVYVLGAASPAERAETDAHLAGCADCRSELDQLAGLPALLALLSEEEAVAAARPPVPLRSRPPRRRVLRAAGLAAAAVVLAVAGALGGARLAAAPAGQGAVQSYGPAGGPWQTASAVSGGRRVTVMYRPMGWGTQLQAQVSGFPPGVRCKLVLVTGDEGNVTAGGWVTDANEGKIWYPASAGIAAGDVRLLEVTAGNTTVQVRPGA